MICHLEVLLGGHMEDRILTITSAQNEKIKLVLKLKEKRNREEFNLFIIEGYREISRAFDSHHPIDTLYLCEELFLGSNEDKLIQEIGERAALIRVPKHLFEKFSYRDRPDGLLALAPIQKKSLKDLVIDPAKTPLIIVAESIEKPGNLGSILRSADATLVSAVIVCDPCTDIYNPNVVRASVGTLFSVPVIQASTEETMQYLRDNGILIVAATPHTDTLYTEVDLKQPVAIAVGTEQLGLSDAWMQSADIKVKIPMLGIADSLNVAAATTLLLYEAIRQRYGT